LTNQVTKKLLNMKKQLLSLVAVAICAFTQNTNAQTNSYWTSGMELIFSWSDAQFTDDFMTQYSDAVLLNDPVRFTVVLNISQNRHFDFSNSIGMFTGIGLRNVGMITNERLPQQIDGAAYQDYKLIRRQYTLGVPLALKIGNFDKGFFLFGGGEIEWAFVFKQKYWNTLDRSGEKTKSVDWFGNQTPAFLPSVFGGIQFPGGVNVRFKYYLTDFLNNNYKLNTQASGQFNVGDLTRYESTQLFYIAVSYSLMDFYR
jgi:hypothetical protein